jgi:hypothetical protein
MGRPPNYRCPQCGGTLESTAVGEIYDGLPGIEYVTCRSCGYLRASNAGKKPSKRDLLRDLKSRK